MPNLASILNFYLSCKWKAISKICGILVKICVLLLLQNCVRMFSKWKILGFDECVSHKGGDQNVLASLQNFINVWSALWEPSYRSVNYSESCSTKKREKQKLNKSREVTVKMKLF